MNNQNVLSELYKIPVSEWGKIWCTFNVWKVPESLVHIKPSWWEDPPSKEKTDRMSDFMRPIMDEIMSKLGHKAVNREWNRERMTDEEHEKFWNEKFK